MLPNTADFVVALFAAWRLGAAVTPINPPLMPVEVGYQLDDAGAKVLIVEQPSDSASAPVVLTTTQLTTGEPAAEDAMANQGMRSPCSCPPAAPRAAPRA